MAKYQFANGDSFTFDLATDTPERSAQLITTVQRLHAAQPAAHAESPNPVQPAIQVESAHAAQPAVEAEPREEESNGEPIETVEQIAMGDEQSILFRVFNRISSGERTILLALYEGAASREALDARFPRKPTFANGLRRIFEKCKEAGLDPNRVIGRKYRGKGMNRALWHYPAAALKEARWILTTKAAKEAGSERNAAEDREPLGAIVSRMNPNMQKALKLVKRQPLSIDQLRKELRLSGLRAASGLIGKLRAVLKKHRYDPDEVFCVEEGGGHGLGNLLAGSRLEELPL